MVVFVYCSVSTFQLLIYIERKKMNRESEAQELWQQLLGQQPTNEDLRYIIEWVEPLREQAQRLIKMSKKEIMKRIRRL